MRAEKWWRVVSPRMDGARLQAAGGVPGIRSEGRYWQVPREISPFLGCILNAQMAPTVRCSERCATEKKTEKTAVRVCLPTITQQPEKWYLPPPRRRRGAAEARSRQDRDGAANNGSPAVPRRPPNSNAADVPQTKIKWWRGVAAHGADRYTSLRVT